MDQELLSAADKAAKTLNKIGPPKPILTISGLQDEELVVIEKQDKLTVIGKDEIHLYVDTNRFRQLMFTNLERCTIHIDMKLLRLIIHDCKDIKIVLNNSPIGPVEIFRCSDSMIEIHGIIPLVMMELSQDIQILQNVKELVYVIIKCIGLECDVVYDNVYKNYSVGKLFWKPEEFELICMSSDGISTIPMEYVLNNISHMYT